MFPHDPPCTQILTISTHVGYGTQPILGTTIRDRMQPEYRVPTCRGIWLRERKIKLGENVRLDPQRVLGHTAAERIGESIRFETGIFLPDVAFKGKRELEGANFLNQHVAGAALIML